MRRSCVSATGAALFVGLNNHAAVLHSPHPRFKAVNIGSASQPPFQAKTLSKSDFHKILHSQAIACQGYAQGTQYKCKSYMQRRTDHSPPRALRRTSFYLLFLRPFATITPKGGEFMNYYPAYICENGHAVETASQYCDCKFCSTCGARVISKCSHCQTPIQGHEYGSSGYYRAPKYCTGCGKPYPWVISAIEATTYLVQESDLCFSDQQKIIEILPDVIAETPKTQLAAFRIGKVLASGGKFLAEGIRQFVIDFGCEFLKKQFDL